MILLDMEQITLKDQKLINYLTEISASMEYNLHLVGWNNTVILRNCTEAGALVDLADSKQQITPWVQLTFKDFTFKSKQYGIFACMACCSNILTMSIEQNPEEFKDILCDHSKVVAALVDAQKLKDHKVDDKDTVKIIHEKTGKGSKSQHLIVVYLKKEVTFLYTKGKQTTPRCSTCSCFNCKCFQHYKKFIKCDKSQEAIEIETENKDHDSGEVDEEPTHYLQRDANMGYNVSQIKYPLFLDPQQNKMCKQRQEPDFDFPAVLYPEYNPETVCNLHNNRFKEDDSLMRSCAEEIVLYEDTKETIFKTRVLYRESIGPCKCRQQYDGHEYLVLHMGNGRMVCYFTLLNHVHSWVNSGISAYATFRAIKNNISSRGQESSLSQQLWTRAVDGFVFNLTFDLEMAFSCINCGISPKYFVGDGKCTGPLQRKLHGLNVSELSSHPDDRNILQQGSKFADRVFLSNKKERDLVFKLITGETDMATFILSEEIISENGKLVTKLVKIIHENSPLSIPEPYVKLLADISKAFPVAGLIQVNSSEPLNLLRLFAKQKIDIRSASEYEKAKCLERSIPSFWHILMSICELENTSFLPIPVANIVLALLKVRKQTFSKAPQRFTEDYVRYEKTGIFSEDPTQCYPMHEIIRYPKQYKVSGKVDDEHCDKTFPSHTDFLDGIFSIGCCCSLAVTYGFELMMGRESARHFFRFLMCRKVNFENLEGIIEDFACGLQPYALNREPEEFKYVRFLVDGSHWNGQRKLKKADRSGKGGHLGCSSGYNFNEYKKHIDITVNSQGREQTNSLIEKCANSLRQKNYFNFMRYMKCFFAIRNLMSMKRINI